MADVNSPSPDRIEELLVPVLELRDAQRSAALDELCDTHPELAGSLRKRIALFERMLATVPDEGDGPRTFGEFDLVRELGHGGMGVVYLARQRRGTTERMVALKLVQDRGLFSSQARERFRREAEATFRLDHPVFCPILDIGEVEGTPYLAMRFVPGETLAGLIEHARKAEQSLELPQSRSATDSGDSSQSGSSADRSARILHLIEQVARALHIAHEAGLVHRDVKPGNIMVTPEGAPVLLDFGLVRDDSEAEVRLTLTGQPIGTPAYMSPEQLSPKGRRLDRTTDVYSLGATLYEALTLRPPFRARTREELYRAILTENPPDPRSLAAGVSRDIKVVLDTALDKDPARRYATARELADDLRRARLHQPILARPAGVARRLRLWTVRNRMASAILGLLLVSQVAILFLASESRRSAEQALQERTRALEHLRSARNAIAELVSAAEEHLSDVPWLEPVRQELFSKALAFYSDLLELESGDPTLRLDAVTVRRELAALLLSMGRAGEAEVLLGQARTTLEELGAAGVDRVSPQLARTHMLEGRTARARGDVSAQAAALEAAVETYRAWLETPVGEDADYLGQVESLTNLAALRRDVDRRDEARALLEEAHAALDRIRSHESHDVRRARVYGESARLYRDLRDYDAADGEFEAAARLLRARLSVQPHDRTAAALLGTNRISHGLQHNQRREYPEAQKAYEEAIEIFERLDQAFPTVPSYQANLATALNNLSTVRRRVQDPDGALELLDRSIQVSQRLIAASPDFAEHKERLARSYANMAELHRARSVEESLPYYRLALEILEELIAEQPEILGNSRLASDLNMGLGTALAELGLDDEAGVRIGKARELAARVKSYQLDNPSSRRQYGFVLYNEAWWLLNNGDAQAGAARMREAIAERQWLVDNYPNDARALPELLDAWVRLGWIAQLGDQDLDTWIEAEAALAGLIEGRQVLDQQPRLRFNLACYWAGLARSKANAGDGHGAEEALAQAVSRLDNPEDDPWHACELLRCLTLRSRLHREAENLIEADAAAREAAALASRFDPERVDDPARRRLLPSIVELRELLPGGGEQARAVEDLLERLRNR